MNDISHADDLDVETCLDARGMNRTQLIGCREYVKHGSEAGIEDPIEGQNR
ncbi:hypothetical protein [Pandoraea eparura]|uniref:hypothetical protein n=1 Tax=Pandoraea eparura TaxID=2508291 RepID=UPI001FE7074F|nr:hypothetical protein [Pandoraea eparura]